MQFGAAHCDTALVISLFRRGGGAGKGNAGGEPGGPHVGYLGIGGQVDYGDGCDHWSISGVGGKEVGAGRIQCQRLNAVELTTAFNMIFF